MSTKTTFKRVALVAVAALALGGVSTVTANAAQTVANTYLNCTKGDGGSITPSATKGATCAGVAGVANTVNLTVVSSAKDILIVPSSSVLSASTQTGLTIATGGVSAVVTAGNTPTIQLATTAVGTITVSVYTATAGSGIYSATAAETVVVTVGAVAQSGTLDLTNSTIYIAKGETDTAVAADSVVVAAASADAAVAKATIQGALVDLLGTAFNDTITATITGAGNVYMQTLAVDPTTATAQQATLITQNATAGTVSANVYTKNGKFFATIFSNGQAGVATVSIQRSSGVVIGTKTLTFSGSTAKLVASPLVNYIANNGTSTADVFKVLATDSAGNAVTGQAPTMVVATADTARATAGACTEQTTKGTYYCAITAASLATEGKVSVTFKGADVTTVVSDAVSTFISTVKAATLTVTGADSAAPGDKVTFTLTAKNAAGNPIADGTYTLFASNTSNASLPGTNTLWSTTADLVDGVATSYAYAPQNDFSVTWTLAGTAATTSAAAVGTANLVDALGGTKVTAAVAVANPSTVAAQAAIDAAQEATDAANAAYDAANNAMDSADAATAAAQDASDNASAALAAVTSLSATVAKLVASVSAIAASLASIKKKLGVK